jgi:hypothetical protein
VGLYPGLSGLYCYYPKAIALVLPHADENVLLGLACPSPGVVVGLSIDPAFPELQGADKGAQDALDAYV